MAILNLKEAAINGKVSHGSVLINSPPMVRSGKKNDYMVGQFLSPEESYDFKIWEEDIFSIVQANGTGIYDVEVIGAEFNGFYFTVKKIEPSHDTTISKHDFLPFIPRDYINKQWLNAIKRLKNKGVSDKCWGLVQEILADPELENRFTIEGAAVHYHDNKIGGLVNHTTKMLNILVSLFDNHPELQECADLMAFSIVVHDIGKVFEYRDLAPSEYWYANHRVRGIEFLTKYKDKIIDIYDETFYRQVQSVISGHHGDFGDRPTSVAAGIVHYIDTLESQVTGLIEAINTAKGDR
ncbi:MAG: hypothetical protein GX326_06545, partial [Clostridiaceae bacterium]|nr:hypothetical protein [Clostridiaceae bacterium]